MSKIGRKAIDISGVQVDIKGQEVHFKGAKSTGVHELPSDLKAEVVNQSIFLKPSTKNTTKDERALFRNWGLHRALLSNKIKGARQSFAIDVQINGLGYKAAQSGNKLVLTLGYSHKIDFDLPKNVTVSIDKTGQKLTFESPDNVILGMTVSRLKALKPTEPYKGTGVRRVDDIVLRKDSKKKA